MLQTAEPRTLTHTTISKKMLHAPLCLEYCVTSKACSDLGPSLPKPTAGHCGMVQRLSSSVSHEKRTVLLSFHLVLRRSQELGLPQ